MANPGNDNYEKIKNFLTAKDDGTWTSEILSASLKFQFPPSLTGRLQQNSPPMQSLSDYSLNVSWNLSDYQDAVLKWVYGDLPSEDQEVRFLREKPIPTEPVRAYKLAHIKAVGTGLKFRGVVLDCTYAPEDRYKCTCKVNSRPQNHEKPEWGNNACGFYAMRKVSSLRYYPQPHSYLPGVLVTSDVFELEVELYGKVLEGKKGYRAEYQRVLSAKPWKPIAPGNFYLASDGKLRYNSPEYRQLDPKFLIPYDVQVSLADVERMLGTEMHLP